MSKLEEELLEFLRNGDDETAPPEQFGLKMDLGPREHKYLARVIAEWFERNYAALK